MTVTYQNPVCTGADPFVLLHNGTYYHYTSNNGFGFRLLLSDNLRDWTDGGICLDANDVLGEQDFWAPEVLYHNERFYMAYTADWNVGIAVSDAPTGPFVQTEKKWATANVYNPEYHKGNGAIDGHFFKDDDGKIYLYYARHYRCKNRIFVAEVNDNLTAILPETERLVAEPEQPWEVAETAQCNEGPFVLKHGGTYYLTYSGNDYQSPHYGIGCAVSDSPFGPFRKYPAPLLKRTELVNGVGHHSFTTSKDGSQLICVYHCHQSYTAVEPRMTCIDPASFVRDGNGTERLTISGPSRTLVEIQI